MLRLRGVAKNFAWGSRQVIPEFVGSPEAVGTPEAGEPVAELWFGAHPRGPAMLADGSDLREHLTHTPESLGEAVAQRFGGELPYLVKLIAPATPLSMQVHPDLHQAREGRRRARGGGADAPVDYVDTNHKPEVIYALSPFEAVSGFRAPRRAAELFVGLDTPIARSVRTILTQDPSSAGMLAAFQHILRFAQAQDSAKVAAECATRIEAGRSPSVRSDRITVALQEEFPGDRGVIAALLLNPVSLQPGEVMYVPAGAVHAYLHGFGLEVMANSDNVLRAGLTRKNVDIPELLRIVDPVAAPPIRLAGEKFGPRVTTFYAPIDDFELTIVTSGHGSTPLPGRGPRIVLALEGELAVESSHPHAAPPPDVGGANGGLGSAHQILTPGQAVFVSARETDLRVSGPGRLAQVDVP